MADYNVRARREIAIPTPVGGWTWGALRAHVASKLLSDVPDDYTVRFEHPDEIRLLEPLWAVDDPAVPIGPATPIEYLDLAVRSYNILKREGTDTIGELLTLTPDKILQYRNSDPKTVEDCRTRLAAVGLQWPNAQT